jgi:molybdopterin-containing oxidoreductase family iron-sulfur binding subunit
LNPQTAIRLEVKTGDIVRIGTAHGSIEAPVVIYPALHPNAIAMPIGQGHEQYGRTASGIGANPLAILEPTADAATGALAYAATRVTVTKVRDARSGYHSDEKTLVLVQDRDGGVEPEAVKDLIHTTAREWRQAQPMMSNPGGSLTHRAHTPEGNNPA